MSIPLNQRLQCKPEEVLALLENYSAAVTATDEVIKYSRIHKEEKKKRNKLLNMKMHKTWETTWVPSHSLDPQVTFPWSNQMSCGIDQKRDNNPRKEAQ